VAGGEAARAEGTGGRGDSVACVWTVSATGIQLKVGRKRKKRWVHNDSVRITQQP
jgi:hypothetical protein